MASDGIAGPDDQPGRSAEINPRGEDIRGLEGVQLGRSCDGPAGKDAHRGLAPPFRPRSRGTADRERDRGARLTPPACPGIDPEGLGSKGPSPNLTAGASRKRPFAVRAARWPAFDGEVTARASTGRGDGQDEQGDRSQQRPEHEPHHGMAVAPTREPAGHWSEECGRQGKERDEWPDDLDQ
jgi:hypothetical protein